MTTIQLDTKIQTSIEKAFTLSLDIDFHKKSASQTNEEAIAGVTSGIIKLNETVTWRGKHLGIFLTHKSIISALEHPYHFIDEMVQGQFKSFKHRHYFEEKKGVVYMKDIITYTTPYGILGKLLDVLFIKNHMTQFITHRNLALKNELEA